MFVSVGYIKKTTPNGVVFLVAITFFGLPSQKTWTMATALTQTRRDQVYFIKFKGFCQVSLAARQ